MRRTFNSRRSSAVIAIIGAAIAVFLVRLYIVQVVQAKEARETAALTVTVPVEPLRGEIRDRNGNLLVTNRQVRTIVFNFGLFPPGKDAQRRNEIILALIRMFDSHKDAEWIDELPLQIVKDKPSFMKDKPVEVSYLKSKAFLHLNPYATAEDCFAALVERYQLETYSLKDARDIASVYYSMHKEGFNAATPYVFATDVPQELVAAVKERSDVFPGVDMQVEARREYVDGNLAPHLLGVVGAISASEYEARKEEGYNKNDQIGKNGLEYTLEPYLRGTRGEKVITVDRDGNTTETYTSYPVQGDTVILTIDRDLQRVTQDALRNLIMVQQSTRGNVTSGAIVVMDTKNNDVLACASYPTFNLNTYNKNSAKLNASPSKPLWNRPLRSTYTPGSTIKPCVAMAGLQEGVITKDTYIYCSGKYRYFSDYQPGCMGFHGGQNVVNALYHSCNIFFYETARLLGIEKLNRYFSIFGLGQKTGVELAEAEGNIDSYQFRASRGELWTPGLTIQAGIGHGDNTFTPIQLCSYVSMIANRGTRYRAHLVKSVMSSDFSETHVQSQTEVLAQADFAEENWDLVHQGMLYVGKYSYADFSKVPVNVAAKTGTTTVEKYVGGGKIDTYNGLILTFAPFEDPEIAIAVVIEGAGSGGSTAPAASAIMEYYFANKPTNEPDEPEDTLLR